MSGSYFYISTCHTKRDSLKSVKIKVGKRCIIVQEERDIRHDDKFMIASKTRPGIDLESLVAKHELSVDSKSMFTTDGMPIPCNDKSMLLSTLEEHVEYKLTPPLKPPI